MFHDSITKVTKYQKVLNKMREKLKNQYKKEKKNKIKPKKLLLCTKNVSAYELHLQPYNNCWHWVTRIDGFRKRILIRINAQWNVVSFLHSNHCLLMLHLFVIASYSQQWINICVVYMKTEERRNERKII